MITAFRGNERPGVGVGVGKWGEAAGRFKDVQLV